MQRNLAIHKYENIIRGLSRQLSFSTTIVDVTDELLASIREDSGKVDLRTVEAWTNDKEPYRVKLRYMLQKLQNMRDDSFKNTKQRYQTVTDLMADIEIIDRSLRHHYADFVANTYLSKFIRQVELFGFHLAALDVRQHSKEHENAMTELLARQA